MHSDAMRCVQDQFVKQAVLEQYRCRSAFKLIELDDKHHIFRKGIVVVSIFKRRVPSSADLHVSFQIDCGAKPGI